MDHQWVDGNDTIKWAHCRVCLVIKRADGRNGPCRGYGRIRTFDECFSNHHLKRHERVALVHHLASFRYRKTIEALLVARPDAPQQGEGNG